MSKNFWNGICVVYFVDKIAVVIFIVDYLLRWFTADHKLNKGKASFILYPVMPMAVLDLLCILPSGIITAGFMERLNDPQEQKAEEN